MFCAVVASALAPAYVVRWHVGFYPTTLLEAAILLTIAVYVGESVFTGQPLFRPTRLDLPIALFLLAGAISVIVSSDHRAALGLYRAYFLEPAAFYYVLVGVVRNSRRAFMILLGFGIGMAWLAIPNIQVTLKAIKDHTLNVGGTPPVAVYSVSNAVALFEVPVVTMAAAVLLYGRWWLERTICAAIVGLGTVSLLLTFSRGGYLALFAVAIALALTHRWRLWLLAGVAVATIAALRVPGVSTRIAHELSFSDRSNSIAPRLKLWGVTLRMLAHHPIFGSGLSGFASAIEPYRNGYAEQQIYPHNILLNFWTETGILGVIAFGWLLVQGSVENLRGWLHGPAGWRPYQLGVVLFLLAILVHGLVDVPFFKNDLSFQFWAFLGVGAAAGRWADRLAGTANGRFRGWRVPFLPGKGDKQPAQSSVIGG